MSVRDPPRRRRWTADAFDATVAVEVSEGGAHRVRRAVELAALVLTAAQPEWARGTADATPDVERVRC